MTRLARSLRAVARRCLGLVPVLAGAAVLAAGSALAGVAPAYPPSAHITGMTLDWGTYKRLAPGSDNWPLTWSADGHQYTSFGDGGGFGGTGSRGRVSLGFARVEGEASDFRGYNVWGGYKAENAAAFPGKSRGMLAIGADLYMWRCGAGSNKAAYDFQRLYKSTDKGKTWKAASWQFPKTVAFFCPAFLQFGQGYAGARDDYVYMYSTERNSGEWEIPVPGRISLMRAPKGRLMNRASYQFFAGRAMNGTPIWSADVAQRKPVFEDPNGARLPSAVYDPGLGRYLLVTNFAPRGVGNIAVFDAPEPWGPWTTAAYVEGWGKGQIDTSTFYMNFSPKWWSDGGKGFVAVFTGTGTIDSWNSVRGTFRTPGARGRAAGEGSPDGGERRAAAVGGEDPGETASAALVGAEADVTAAAETVADAPGRAAVAAATAGALNVMPAGSLTSMTYNYLTAQAKQVWDGVRDPRVAAIDTPAEVAAHKAWVRSRVLARLGGLPSPAPGGLNVRVTGTLDRDGYQVDKLIYESQANLHVTANLYRPKTGTAPFPAVVGIPGHADDGTGKAYADYQKVWIALAKRGFVVLVADPFGQGERLEQWDAARNRPLAGKSGTDEHTIAGTKMYLTGTNPERWMAFDVMRGIDLLRARGDVDAGKIAVIGNSGGGVQTGWMAALDDRVAAAGPSCGVNTYEAMWQGKRGLNDAEQNLWGFVADGLSQADLYAGLAPKPLKIFAAKKDYNPIKGTREAFAEIKTHFYGVLGAPGNVELFEADDSHGWTKPRREETDEWLERVFKGAVVNYVEPADFATEPAANLRATGGGQVHDDGGPGGATTHSTNYAIAQGLHAGRAALTTGDLAGLVRDRLAMGPAWSGPPSATARGTLSGTGYNGYRIQKVALATEPGITAPGLLFVPTAAAAGPRPGVLYLNDAGKAADASDTGPIAAIARSGRIVLAVDARQWGESAYPACKGYACKNHQNAVRALTLGRSLVGMQTRDTWRALDYLAARPEVDAANLAVVGKAKAGVAALFTAFLDGRVKKVHLAGTPASYLSIAGTQRPGELMDIVIGKVLADFDLPDLEAKLGGRLTRTTTTAVNYVAWLNAGP